MSGVSTARKTAECRPAVHGQFGQDTLSFYRFQTRFWLECEVTFRFITLLPTRSHRQHCHKSRKVWRAGNTQKCGSVVGRKSELLSIIPCELLTSLSSQDSVLMERLLWKDSVVSSKGGLHCKMQVKVRHSWFRKTQFLWGGIDDAVSVNVVHISGTICLRA